MKKNNKLEDSIKKYIYEISGTEVSVYDDIIDLGILQSMDFIMLVNFIKKTTKINFSQEDLNKDNFRSVSSILKLIELKNFSLD